MNKVDMENRKKEIELRVMELQKNIVEPLEAHDNFWKFCVYYDPLFFTERKRHLKQIAGALQDIADGRIKKLAISLPPRGGKSYVISLFCAWMLGRNPKGSVMRNSYAAKLAEKFSKDIRDGILLSDRFRKVFPGAGLSSSNSAVDGWSIEGNTQPSYFCAGVGGPITGFGCNLLAILDDPIKNIEEALSELTIENVWNWYTSTHLSRLETGCPEIHIATRWSRKDPIGRLTDPFSEEYDPDMVVIRIPALDDRGRSFCEDVKTTEEYHQIKKITESSIWEAEYMQNPIEEKGLLFPIESLKKFTLMELGNRQPDGIVSVCDTADEGTDYLCMPVDKIFGSKTYIVDVLFTQDGVEVTEPMAAKMIIDNRVQVLKVEANSGGKSWARNVKKLFKPKWHCQVMDEQTTTNKETRILMNSGYVKEYFYFRSDYTPGSDYDKFMRYLTSYVKMGTNKHDDAPDAVTMLAEYIQTNFRARKRTDSDLTHGGTYTYVELKMKGYREYEIDRMAREGQIKVIGGKK
jgi:predicted phage terminase large subunit-like protein